MNANVSVAQLIPTSRCGERCVPPSVPLRELKVVRRGPGGPPSLSKRRRGESRARGARGRSEGGWVDELE